LNASSRPLIVWLSFFELALVADADGVWADDCDINAGTSKSATATLRTTGRRNICTWDTLTSMKLRKQGRFGGVIILLPVPDAIISRRISERSGHSRSDNPQCDKSLGGGSATATVLRGIQALARRPRPLRGPSAAVSPGGGAANVDGWLREVGPRCSARHPPVSSAASLIDRGPPSSSSGRAAAAGGAREGSARHSRIACVVSGGWIAARIRVRLPQRGHSRTSTAKTRRRRSAHASRRGRAELGASGEDCRGGAGTASTGSLSDESGGRPEAA